MEPGERFKYRLALAFHRWDVDDFLEEISAEQFDRWRIFAGIEPFGAFADDQRHGMQMAMTANINRDGRKKKEPFAAVDFMLSKVDKAAKKLPGKVLREQMEAVLGKPVVMKKQ